MFKDNLIQPPLKWPVEKPFDDYMINLKSDRGLVQDVEELLCSRQLNIGLMKAQVPVDMNTNTDPAGTNKIKDRNLPTESTWSSSGFQRGFGSSLHDSLRGATYKVWAAEALLELCRQK